MSFGFVFISASDEKCSQKPGTRPDTLFNGFKKITKAHIQADLAMPLFLSDPLYSCHSLGLPLFPSDPFYEFYPCHRSSSPTRPSTDPSLISKGNWVRNLKGFWPFSRDPGHSAFLYRFISNFPIFMIFIVLGLCEKRPIQSLGRMVHVCVNGWLHVCNICARALALAATCEKWECRHGKSDRVMGALG